MLQIKGLTKYYRNVAVVDEVSFDVRPGEVTGYLGPNGSGKSTTVKMITTLLETSRGHVLLDGRDIREDLAGFKQRLGYVPEEPILYFYMTGLEYLQFISGGTKIKRSAGAVLAAHTSACADLGVLQRHEAARVDHGTPRKYWPPDSYRLAEIYACCVMVWTSRK